MEGLLFINRLRGRGSEGKARNREQETASNKHIIIRDNQIRPGQSKPQDEVKQSKTKSDGDRENNILNNFLIIPCLPHGWY